MKKEKYMLLFFLLACCMQNIIIINFETFGLKFFHIVSLIFFFPIIKNKIIKLPNKKITLTIAYFLIVSLFAMIKYGFHSLLFNYIFAYYILIIILNFGNKMTVKDWDWVLIRAAWISLILVYCNAFKNIDIILKFLKNPFGHPVYTFIFGGGANLEATWIGLFAFLLPVNKKAYLYNTLCFIISAVLASRVGVICNIICYIYLIFFKEDDNLNKKFLQKIIMCMFLMCILLIIFNEIGLFDYVLERFFSIGKDPGSQGRLSMWKYIGDAFVSNVFGYGLGNSIKAISLVAGYTIKEGNVHNLMFQMMLDTGLIGLIIYLSVIIYFFKLALKYFFANKYVAYLTMYFLLGFIQFRGGDCIMFYILGIFIQLRLYNKQVMRGLIKGKNE